MLSIQQHPKIPKYYKLAELLRQHIQSGALPPGSRLPSVAQMQAQHGVSLSTINQAHALLEKDGLIVREQGRGTFVAQPSAPRTTKTLGFILHTHSLVNFYMMDLLAGIHSEVTRQGVQLLWLSDQEVGDGKTFEDKSKTFDNRNVDAILMLCDPNEALALNLPAHVPHALLLRHSADFTCITADDFNGTKLATQHLLSLGHRRIACLFHSIYDSVSRQRMAGYRAALQEAGVQQSSAQEDDGLIQVLKDPTGDGYLKSGERTMAAWLKAGWSELGCTAILAHNDQTAIGVMRVLAEHGIRVPEDISVVGFDGTELSELSTPALTTIKVPLQEVGATAVKVLVAQMEQGVWPETQKVMLPVQFKAGRTTAALKIGSDNNV
jgi:GntR family transcriptional regulator of arabinose operon